MTDTPIRIGLCTDLSGPYENVDGNAGAEAIRMAIEEMKGTAAGRPIELVLGDHQNDEQEAASIARRWYADEGVDVVISGVNSDTSLAMTAVATELGKPIFVVGAGTSVQTRERSAPTVIQYAYSTVALATAPAIGLVQQGLKRWFFVTADYPFGRELEEHGTAAIRTVGGTVVGSVKNPHGADDFIPFLEQARDSGAEVLGLANGHAELLKAMAAMEKLGLGDRMKLVGLLTFVDDIHHMGLQKAKGLYLADSWYWTRDDNTRRWSERFYERQQRMPSSLQAADYSAALQFLKAVDAVGGADPQAVVQQLRGATLNDEYVRDGRIRDDGTMLHDIYLLRVKAPDASNGEWDVYEHVATVSGPEAFPQ
ncbi:ABC transporter substrate-binding protein [Mesorhizobium sp.]|uniref:ABC transporter substrate-binding protein n=1 Tax=Mesorhizobium sp. TaxID=1871066 RepID=UPI000FE3DC93|nr:ABC transporter substrate-binding protein [Mesorhizobium sp.]RWH72886.1 MAG: ABC transporter substrate-binding protein [Mesorhizobium sp.]RWL34228.1 MAG: ABC transporter substrate-binding protein [Mesorhizobium sp.]RWL35644.1 MAG: ABC transporter substrate-binding protein [Mesorhizobium sp.]RWL41054.1 MAG: ABC transporter substrate-binding protein [Mesorhizobium sp.]RWL52180.1 MAG: ABC transporter substrate-binding protein [Mesorhizobium sp.]